MIYNVQLHFPWSTTDMPMKKTKSIDEFTNKKPLVNPWNVFGKPINKGPNCKSIWNFTGMCLFPFHRKGFSCLNKTIMQCQSLSQRCYAEEIVLHQVPLSPRYRQSYKGSSSRQLYKRVSIKLGKATRSKRKLLSTFWKPTVKARGITAFLLTNLGSRSDAALWQILSTVAMPREVF